MNRHPRMDDAVYALAYALVVVVAVAFVILVVCAVALFINYTLGVLTWL